MKKIALATIMLSLLVFSNCKKDEPTEPVRTYADVQADFQAIDASAGTHDERLEYYSGVNWDFRAIIPNITSGQTYPLVIDLHGASGGAADAHKNTACYVEPGFEGHEVFIISPNGGAELWNSFRNQDMVLNLQQLAKDFWPIDPDKIVVTGYSNGGNGSWFFGETQASIFSAAIPIASSYSTLHPDGSYRQMPVPMYVIHGENDTLFPLSDTQEWVAETVNVGSDVTLVVAPDLGHYEPCNYVPYLQDAVDWLMDEVWN